jgi:hypothetical protein
MNDNISINDVCEAVLVTTALNAYAAEIRAKYGTEDQEMKLLLQYVNTVYSKYYVIAKTPVVRDALGNLTIKRETRRNRADLN